MIVEALIGSVTAIVLGSLWLAKALVQREDERTSRNDRETDMLCELTVTRDKIERLQAHISRLDPPCESCGPRALGRTGDGP